MLLTISHVTMKTSSSMVSTAGGKGLMPQGRRLLPDFVFSVLTRAA